MRKNLLSEPPKWTTANRRGRPSSPIGRVSIGTRSSGWSVGVKKSLRFSCEKRVSGFIRSCNIRPRNSAASVTSISTSTSVVTLLWPRTLTAKPPMNAWAILCSDKMSDSVCAACIWASCGVIAKGLKAVDLCAA